VSRSRRGPDPEERRTDGGRLNQLPSSHSPRGERKLPSRVALPAAVPVSVLALALTAVTTLVVTGATRAPDARALAAGTALDTPGLAHLVARCIALGGQFGLVGTVLMLTAAAVAWHRRVWRPLLVPLAALAALNAATLALKLATGRTAPHAGIDLVFAGGWSYPSGHAVNATVCLPLLVAVGYRNARSGADRREWSPPGPAMAATAVAVAAVGLATVVLGYHWASDVAAGWLLGLAIVLPALRALRPPPASAARTRVSARPSAQARTEPQPGRR